MLRAFAVIRNYPEKLERPYKSYLWKKNNEIEHIKEKTQIPVGICSKWKLNKNEDDVTMEANHSEINFYGKI